MSSRLVGSYTTLESSSSSAGDGAVIDGWSMIGLGRCKYNVFNHDLDEHLYLMWRILSLRNRISFGSAEKRSAALISAGSATPDRPVTT